MGDTIPGIIPPHVQFELSEEMSRLGYDPTGATDGKGWDDFAEYCRENPGTCERFDDIAEQLQSGGNSPMEKLDRAFGDGIDWITERAGALTNTFKENGFDPDNQEIYDSRQDIKLEFMSQYMRSDLYGEKMDPLVAERMEQLIEVHPDEADSRFHSAMDKVLADPEKFGLETESPGFFSDNKGVEFSPGG